MDKRSFYIIPWTENFLGRLHELTDRLTGGRPGSAVLVFPNKRPRRYLLNIYRSSAAPVLPPAMMDVDSFTQACLAEWDEEPRQEACLLDRVALLRSGLVRASASSGDDRLKKIAAGLDSEEGLSAFYPWGVRLASLIDECDSHDVKIRRLDYMEDEVGKYAGALLNSLEKVSALFHREMKTRGWTCAGMDKRRAAKFAADKREIPAAFRDKAVIFCGFVRLTGAEDRLFRYFWENHGRTSFCIHSDPALAGAGDAPEAHWSCADHAAWLQSWGVHARLFCEGAAHSQTYHCFAGYDLHSQLAALKERLDAQADRNVTSARASLHGRFTVRERADWSPHSPDRAAAGRSRLPLKGVGHTTNA